MWLLAGIKYRVLIRYALLFITIFSGASFIGYVFKRKNEETISVILLLIMTILYILGFFNALGIGVYLIAIVFNFLGIVTLFLSIRNKEFSNLISNVFSSGSCIWYFLYMIFTLTTYNRMFNCWDELSCWSISSKNMYNLNSFVLNPKSTVVQVYPPSPTILQFFFLKFIGKYKQGIELFATIMLGFSLVIPLFKKTEKKGKNIIRNICTFIMVLSIPTIFCDQMFYTTIYADTTLGLLLGYFTFKLYTEDTKDMFNFISLTLTAIMIGQTKSTGIILLGIVAFIFLIYFIIYNRHIEKKSIRVTLKDKSFRCFIAIIIVAFIFLVPWKIYVSKNKAEASSITLSSTGSPIKYLVKAYLDTFLTYKIGYSDSNLEQDIESIYKGSSSFFEQGITHKPIDISMTMWLIILGALMLIEYELLNDEKEKKKFKAFSLCSIAGLFLYCLFLQVAYIFVFSNQEGILHNSIERYVGSYLVILFMLVIGTFIYFMENKKLKVQHRNLIWTSLTLFVLIFTPIDIILNATLFSGEYNREKMQVLSEPMNYSEYIKSKVNENDKIYIIHQGIDSNGLAVRYFITPIMSSSVELLNDESTIEDVDELEKIIYNNNYTYLYVYSTDEYLLKNYNSIFENNEIKENTLYKVERQENEKIRLVPVDDD